MIYIEFNQATHQVVVVFNTVSLSIVDTNFFQHAFDHIVFYKLSYNDDGSVDLYFGPVAPKGYENNWVQTLPNQGWRVWFRFYSPKEA